MKSLFVTILSLSFIFTSPVWGEPKVEFSDGITAAEALGIDNTKLTTMEKRKKIDLSKYGIVTGDTKSLTATSDLCSINLRIQNRRVFQHQRNAFAWCDDIHRFTGLRNTCVVRQFGNNFYETDFRFRGVARGSSFSGIFGAIFDFLVDTGLLNDLFEILFDQIFSSSGHRC